MELNRFFPSDSFIYQDYNKEDTIFPYPSDDVDPKEKNKPGWCMAFAQGLWSDYCRNNTSLPFIWGAGTNQMDYTTLRLYGQGNQPNGKYKDQLRHKNPDKEDAQRVSFESISWDNDSIIPRFRESVIEILMGMDIQYSPQGVDEASINERLYIKNYIWEKSRNEFYAKIYKELGITETEQLPFIPEDKKELDMYAQFGLHLAHEFKMKKVVDSIFKDSEWPDEIKKSILEDIFDLGIASTYEGVNIYTRRPEIRGVDMSMLVFPKSKRADYADINKAGEVVFMSILDIRKAMKRNGHFKSETDFIERIKKILNVNKWNSKLAFVDSMNGQPNLFGSNVKDSHGQLPYDYMKVPVFNVEYQSWNTDKTIEKKTIDGAVRRYYEEFNYDKSDNNVRTTLEYQYDTWYKCSWIIGTDICIDWGKKEYVKRDDNGRTKSGYSIYRVSNKSMTATMIPIEDKVEIMTKKYMFAWKRASPAGYAVYMNQLKGMKLGGKQTLHPLEILGIQQDTGTLFLNDRVAQVGGIKNLNTGGSPFSIIPGGLGNILNEYIMAFNFHINQLSVITGISDVLTGADPEKYQLKSVTEMSFQGSLRRIGPLFRGYSVLKKNNYEKVILDIQTIARFDKKGFKTIFTNFSENTTEKILLVASDTDHTYTMKAEVEATDTMKQAILQSSAQAFAKGVMSQSDYLQMVRLVELGDVRFAQELARYKEMKMMQIQGATQDKAIQDNAEAQQASLQAKGQIDEALIHVEGEESRKTAVVEGQIDKEIEQMKLQGKQMDSIAKANEPKTKK